MRFPTKRYGSVLADLDTRARLSSIGHLLTGNVAQIAIGLPALLLTARALGPHGYGVFALVLTYTQVIKRISDFQVWQPLIRFGANLDAEDDRDNLLPLLKYGFLVDFASSLTAWLLALIGALVAKKVVGFDDQALVMVLIYANVLLFSINGAPVAVLRLAGRFRTAAYVQLIAGVLKLALCAAAYLSKADLMFFVCAWAIADSLSPLLLTGFALIELRRQRLHGFYRVRLNNLSGQFPGLWRFTWSSNLSLTIWSSTQMMDTLLVGWLTDPASAGLYYFVKRIARLGQQASAQVQAVVYPDITRLWAAARYDEFRRVVMQTEVLVAGFGLLLFMLAAIFGARMIAWTVGAGFEAAGPLLIIQMLALTLTISGTVMRAALLAMGRESSVLIIVIVSALAFHITAVVLLPLIGPMGANAAHIVLGAIWLMGLAIVFRRALPVSADSKIAEHT